MICYLKKIILSLAVFKFTLSAPVIANSYKLSLLQTWGAASSVPSEQTYVGFQYDFMLGRLRLCLALYMHVSGDDSDVDPLFSIGIGVELGCRWN